MTGVESGSRSQTSLPRAHAARQHLPTKRLTAIVACGAGPSNVMKAEQEIAAQAIDDAVSDEGLDMGF